MRRAGLLLVVVTAIVGVGLVAAFAALGGADRLRASATVTADPCTA